ncbi:acyl-homoserine-lactone synthase [Fulvimarina sp. 2208YS6-2-32]|uniref:Acyl-homoserine-lactone synthase n=1 Tax=Fulvimarina uroteuthidis TaxID=3098149 RepID=A0ABU5I6A1_9HYPH|nr:acyl-homoserine-lactone synthase [Fulvimarina sp. 2208YS6-2-32]MDY8110741.1 acyl-homoserine-lactone synthase [Fulvimarina sp. 2208YS6-2-32]
MHVVAIDADNRSKFNAELDQHFRLRADIFVGELQWTDLTVKDGREYDQFDHRDAVYILAINAGEGVVGGLRLLPTQRPTLMSEIFPQAANMADMPTGPNVYEWTRFFVVPHWRGEGRQSPVSGILFCGLFEYLLREQIETVRCIGETWWMPRFIGFGMSPRPLGIPIRHDRWSLTAFSFEPSHQALASLRKVHGIEHSVLATDRGDARKGDIVHV